MPTRLVQASLLSSLFGVGDQAYADTSTNTITPPQPGDNSQNIALLQANVSPVSSQKDNKKDTSNNQDSTDPGVTIISDSAIVPSTGPLGVSDGSDSGTASSQNTSVYVVRKGDTISEIANMFGVSTDTILWANNMKKGDKLTEGQILLILPVSGVQHTVTKGQTLQGIAKLYKVDVNDIVQANDITIDAPLAVGDQLIIPNASLKSSESGNPISNPSASIAKGKQYYDTHPLPDLGGYFIDPVPGYRLSQGIHDRNAVDLAISSGTPIHAAASGKVVLARYGYNGGFGNVVIVDHPNGTETVYAHQSKLNITTGAEVYQGQVIGYVGSTGHSTGPHLHFEVHGARNPGIDNSWKPWQY